MPERRDVVARPSAVPTSVDAEAGNPTRPQVNREHLGPDRGHGNVGVKGARQRRFDALSLP